MGIEGTSTVTWLSDNVYTNPTFCDPEDCANAPTAAGDYTISDGSPCVPFQQPVCGLIGALGVGCNALPTPAGDVTIVVEGNDAIICWSPVDTTINGNPLVVDAYIIYFAEEAGGPFWFLSYTTDSCYTHIGAAQFADAMFYEVTAYVGEIDLLMSILAEFGEYPDHEKLALRLRERAYPVKRP